MKMLIIWLGLGCLLFAGYVGNALATSYDYGDAPGYTAARHSTPQWQRLGMEWDAESSQKTVDTSDDGVFWSLDGGTNWGHDTVTVGQAVQFRFNMYKEDWGRHIADYLKVWIDWNQDADFSDTDEQVFQDAWYFTSEDGYEYGDGDAEISKSFFTTITIPEEALLGDIWLRARVTCSESAGGYIDNLTATGDFWQGEVEDWKLTVAPVPEPSTMLLFGLGLGGVCWIRRRTKG
jgi:hypothetical protein